MRESTKLFIPPKENVCGKTMERNIRGNISFSCLSYFGQSVCIMEWIKISIWELWQEIWTGPEVWNTFIFWQHGFLVSLWLFYGYGLYASFSIWYKYKKKRHWKVPFLFVFLKMKNFYTIGRVIKIKDNYFLYINIVIQLQWFVSCRMEKYWVVEKFSQ